MPTEIYFATNRRQPRRMGGPFGDRFHTDGPHFFEVGRAQVTWRDATIEGRDWDQYRVAYELEKGVRPQARSLAAGLAPELHRKVLKGGRPAAPACSRNCARPCSRTSATRWSTSTALPTTSRTRWPAPPS